MVPPQQNSSSNANNENGSRRTNLVKFFEADGLEDTDGVVRFGSFRVVILKQDKH